MAAIDDLTQAVADLDKSLADATQRILNKLNQVPQDDPKVVAAVNEIRNDVQALNDLVPDVPTPTP